MNIHMAKNWPEKVIYKGTFVSKQSLLSPQCQFSMYPLENSTTRITIVTDDMTICREEIFGPVQTIQRFKVRGRSLTMYVDKT